MMTDETQPDQTNGDLGEDSQFAVDIGFSSIGNGGPSAWVAIIVQPDGSSRTIHETVPAATNAAIATRAFLGVLKALPPGSSGEVRCRDKTGVDNIATRLKTWEANGWRTTARKPIANRDLWTQIAGMLTAFPDLAFTWADGSGAMSIWAEQEARRLAEAEKARGAY